MTVRVVVVGGGLAGLFAVSELRSRGIDDVLVLDREDGPGGVARTVRRDGYVLEPAAGTLLLPHRHLTPLLEREDVAVTPAAPAASLRYVYTGGRMVAVPASPKAVLSQLVSVRSKLRAALEPFVRPSPEIDDEPLEAFLRRRLGNGLGGMVAWLAASGVFAGDPARLSARAAFPALVELEDEAGSIVRGGVRRLRRRAPGAVRPSSHLPADGMDGLARTLAAPLGDRLRTRVEVKTVVRNGRGWRVEGSETVDAEHLVLAVSPRAAARMVDDELGEVLSGSVAAPVVVVGLGGPAGRVPLRPGFGVLTGPDERGATRGILFESSYAPSRAPEGHTLAKVIAGGADRPNVVEWDDRRVLDTVVGETARMLGTSIDPSFVEIVRHTPGIPQYEIGHPRWLSELDRLLADRPGLHLTGWGYRGVGVGHLAGDAAAITGRIASSG